MLCWYARTKVKHTSVMISAVGYFSRRSSAIHRTACSRISILAAQTHLLIYLRQSTMCIRPRPFPGFPLHCTTDTRLVLGCSYQLWTFFSDLPSYGSIIRHPDQTKGNLPASLHGLTLAQSVTYVVIPVGHNIFRHPVHDIFQRSRAIFQRRRAMGLLKLYTYNATARFTHMPLDRLLHSSMRPKMHLKALREHAKAGLLHGATQRRCH